MDMALGKRRGSCLGSKRGGVVGEKGLGLGFVRYTRGLGRKRVLISNDLEASPMDSAPKTPTKRRCGEGVVLEAEWSLLEALPQDVLASLMDSAPKTPTKRRCGEGVVLEAERSLLEALPQDILIRVLCGVNHEDLKQLFHVSKTIREATLIAKQSHFAYCTPKKIPAFRNAIDSEDSSEFGDIEPPNAPKPRRMLLDRFLIKKDFSDISAVLFDSPDEEQCPRKMLFMGTKI
ncbi:F-box protein At4g05010 [Corylus avellana]|uniref:F-box protein At4g05010 n=1 Tax=Corylus avellana TaxID=13451 RepID=UPI001E216669|nr:F-box protein At4g05010 [Corylus avellana]